MGCGPFFKCVFSKHCLHHIKSARDLHSVFTTRFLCVQLCRLTSALLKDPTFRLTGSTVTIKLPGGHDFGIGHPFSLPTLSDSLSPSLPHMRNAVSCGENSTLKSLKKHFSSTEKALFRHFLCTSVIRLAECHFRIQRSTRTPQVARKSCRVASSVWSTSKWRTSRSALSLTSLSWRRSPQCTRKRKHTLAALAYGKNDGIFTTGLEFGDSFKYFTEPVKLQGSPTSKSKGLLTLTDQVKNWQFVIGAKK